MNQPSRPECRRFKPYPKYKDSCVEWLGEIPAHWEVKRTKFAARLRSGHTPSRQHPEYWNDCTIPWFGLADVWQIRDGQVEYITETAEKISEIGLARSAARLLPRGTVILSRTASVGFSAIMGVDMATTQDFVNWVCGSRLRPEYLLYVFRSMHHEFRRLTMGSTHQTIYMPDVGRFSTPLPPIPEQERVVAFVREHARRIDTLVAKKERLIELLQEKRAALITRAVTKGLDPAIPMKDSGIEWLGEIPANWSVLPLKRLLKRCDYGISEGSSGTGDIRVLTMAHIQDGEVLLPEAGSITDVDSELLLDRYDLLFNRTNSRELVGKVGLFRGSGTAKITFASYLVRMTARRGVVPRFLNFLLNSSGLLGLVRSMAMLSVNQANLNPTRYTQVQVPLPPQGEQERIADLLDAQGEGMAKTTATMRSAIDRLKEYRTALISAAVTGKIDVRGEAGVEGHLR